MAETTTYQKYQALQRELRATLSVARKWTTLPDLLDELGRLRREYEVRVTAPQGESAWIDRFARALRETGAAAKPEQARRTAQVLWPLMGAYEPEALPRGQWEALPRSYA